MNPTRIIAGASNGVLSYNNATPAAQFIPQRSPSRVTAAASQSGASTMNVTNQWTSQYQYYFTGLIPAEPNYTDDSMLKYFYRDIYFHDSVGGSIVDILSSFGYSKFSLRGMSQERTKVYEECLDQLDVQRMLPTITTAYNVDGAFCGSMVFDERVRYFTEILVHDALDYNVKPLGFSNLMPQITVNRSQRVSDYLNSEANYVREHLAALPHTFADTIRKGQYILSPSSTMYIPRKTLTDRPFTSYLHRLLPYYLIERSLFRGTLVEVNRRQRAISHISVGDGDTWIPTTGDLDAYTKAFSDAESDPMGGWIATRDSVTVEDIRQAGEFLKFTDMAEPFVQFKLRALGVSEAFNSQEATYASSDQAYSVFLETTYAQRDLMTNHVFYKSLFPRIALANSFFKASAKRSSIRSVDAFLASATNRAILDMPTLIWHKELEPEREANMLETLDKLSEKGVPIPIRQWLAAGKIDETTLMRDLKEDNELRRELARLTGKDTSHEGEGSLAAYAAAGMPISARHFQKRKSLMARLEEIGGQDPAFYNSKGKRVMVHNAIQKSKEQNREIVKRMRRFDDPNYRLQMRKKNLKMFGSYVLKTKA